jgi:cyclopropane fatty-acyl-phospholipid synthase-like methyltransferase
VPVVDEHFVPEDGVGIEGYLERGDRTAVHHLIRYEWACRVIASESGIDTLLDIACGIGYGSFQIAKSFPRIRVTGADYDHDAIDQARRRYSAPNVEFVHGDLVHWDETLGTDAYDCVVCFDTIEHISHREIMMENLVNHLTDDGMLFLSTPVRSTNVLNPGWEHHKIEYSSGSLHAFLRRYFEEILFPDDGSLPCRDVFDRLNRDEVIYLLRMNPVLCRGPIRVAKTAKRPG